MEKGVREKKGEMEREGERESVCMCPKCRLTPQMPETADFGPRLKLESGKTIQISHVGGRNLMI